MDPKNVVLAGHHAPLPDAVSILGVTYRVRRKSLPEGEDGYIVPRKQRIVLGKHLSEEKAEQVLMLTQGYVSDLKSTYNGRDDGGDGPVKHDYENMSIDDICDVYDEMFSSPFAVNWEDNLSNHRQEIIDCIESGVPQDEDTIAGGWTEEDGVPGVDFAL